jgi:predicted nuclease of predicted toxin-antitoxin system
MPEFLIDENLPYKFSYWDGEDFVHQNEIDGIKSDEEIWEYPKNNNLTIITKDADFSDRIIFSEPPPKVIHIRIGNLRIKEMHQFFGKNWEEILNHSENFKLTNVYKNRIEGIE